MGILLVAGGQVWLSVTLHPASSVSPMNILYSAIAVMLGTSTAASAMLGMAEAYENLATEAGRLLSTKVVPADSGPVCAPEHLRRCNRVFWRAYALTAAGIVLFLLGILCASVLLADAVYVLYLIGLSGTVALLGCLVGLWEGRLLRRADRQHSAVAVSVRVLAAQPDRPPEASRPEGASTGRRRHPLRRGATRTGPSMRPLIVR